MSDNSLLLIIWGHVRAYAEKWSDRIHQDQGSFNLGETQFLSAERESPTELRLLLYAPVVGPLIFLFFLPLAYDLCDWLNLINKVNKVSIPKPWLCQGKKKAGRGGIRCEGNRPPCAKGNSYKETLLMSSEQVTSLTASLPSRTLQIKQGRGLLSRSPSPPQPSWIIPICLPEVYSGASVVSLRMRRRQQPPSTPLPTVDPRYRHNQPDPRHPATLR